MHQHKKVSQMFSKLLNISTLVAILVTTLYFPNNSGQVLAQSVAGVTVTGVSDNTIANGQSITISGSGFGTKVAVNNIVGPPVLWDNFEDGTNGQLVQPSATKWDRVRSDNTSGPRYYSGAIDGSMGVRTGSGIVNGVSAGHTRTLMEDDQFKHLYLDYYIRAYKGEGLKQRSSKQVMIWSANAGISEDGPNTAFWQITQGGEEPPFAFGQYVCGNDPWINTYGNGWGVDEFTTARHVQIEYRQPSAIGVNDGHVRIWYDGVLVTDQMPFGSPSCNPDTNYLDNLFIGHFQDVDSAIEPQWKWISCPSDSRCNECPAGVSGCSVNNDAWLPARQDEFFYDNIYIDKSIARVELGNAPTYTASTRREVQVPTSWGSSIQITVNKGGFSSGQTAYLYVVDASGNVNSSGYPVTIDDLSTPFVDTIAPTAPSNLNTSATNTQVSLNWNVSTDNVGVSQYLIERSVSASSGFVQIATANTNSYINTGLAVGTTYYYRVRAKDANNNMSSYSNTSAVTIPTPIVDTTAPTTPTNLLASVAGNQVSLSWSSSTDNVGVSQYLIERSLSASAAFTQIATVSTNSYIDNALANSTTYYYRVRAKDASNNYSTYSSTANATTGVAVLGNNLVQNSWDFSASSWNADAVGTNPWSPSSSFVFTGGQTDPFGTNKAFKIALANGNRSYQQRDSSPNIILNYDQVTASLYVKYGNTPNIIFGINDTTSNVEYEQVFTFNTTGVPSWTSGTNYNSANSSHSVVSVGNGWYRLTMTENLLGRNIKGHSFKGRVTPAGSSATSGHYSYVTGFQLESGSIARAYVETPATIIPSIDTQAPSTPTSLIASATSTQINLSWSASTDNVGVSQYLLERSISAGSSFSQITAVNTSSYTDTGLTAGTTYYYRVKAKDEAGNFSAYSTIVSATVPNSVINPPTNNFSPWCSSLLGIVGSAIKSGAYNRVADLNNDQAVNLSDLTVATNYYTANNDSACQARFINTYSNSNYLNIDWCAGVLKGLQDRYSLASSTAYSSIFDLNNDSSIDLIDIGLISEYTANSNQAACFAEYNLPLSTTSKPAQNITKLPSLTTNSVDQNLVKKLNISKTEKSKLNLLKGRFATLSEGTSVYVNTKGQAIVLDDVNLTQTLAKQALGISKATLAKLQVSLSYNDADNDGDQVPNLIEELIGTNPNNKDTDGDGYTDGVEIENWYSPVKNTPKARLDKNLAKRLSGRILIVVPTGVLFYVNPSTYKLELLKNPSLEQLNSLGVVKEVKGIKIRR